MSEPNLSSEFYADFSVKYGLAMESALTCIRLLEIGSSLHRETVEDLESALSCNLYVIAAYHRSCPTLEGFDKDLLPGLYSMNPWKYGLLVRQGLFEVATTTAFHPPSFNTLFHLILRGEAEAEQLCTVGEKKCSSREQVHIAHVIEAVRIYFQKYGEKDLRDSDLQVALEQWEAHPNKRISVLISQLKQGLKPA